MPASPFERAIGIAFPYLVAGLVLAVPLLFIPAGEDPMAVFTVHLTIVVALAIWVAVKLGPVSDEIFFPGRSWSPARQRLASAVVIVVMVTGVAALITIATSAALRFQPSLQFLQLLSVLDIAWAGAAIVLGARWLWGDRGGIVGGIVLGLVCIWSIWNYLRIVGFTEDGGWLVNGGDITRLVLPYDMAAAVVAVALLIAGSRRAVATVSIL